jgi:hypothetical protein
VAPALFGGGAFDGDGHVPAHSPSSAKPPERPQQGECLRREHADRQGCREQPDQSSGDRAEGHGGEQGAAPAGPVAEVAEQEPAGGAGEDADGEGAQREKRGGRPPGRRSCLPRGHRNRAGESGPWLALRAEHAGRAEPPVAETESDVMLAGTTYCWTPPV